MATGNTFGARTWMGGEAIIRLGPGAKFSGNPADYFAPSDWRRLDDEDADIGGSGPVLLDVPGATPSKLIVALGKNGVAYLLNRDDLGGIGKGNGIRGEGVQSNKVSSGEIINAAAAYRTASASYVVFETRASGVGCPSTIGESRRVADRRVVASIYDGRVVREQHGRRIADCDYDRREVGANCMDGGHRSKQPAACV